MKELHTSLTTMTSLTTCFHAKKKKDEKMNEWMV